LEKLLVRLTAATQNAAQSAAAAQSLSSLAPPPELASEADLIGRINGLSAAAQQLARWEQSLAAAESLAAPPIPPDPAPLADLLARFDAAVRQLAANQSQAQAAADELAAAAQALRAAAETSLCPTCGSPLDAERLLARAAAGLTGGHAHD
jgi:hypothetical protein